MTLTLTMKHILKTYPRILSKNIILEHFSLSMKLTISFKLKYKR